MYNKLDLEKLENQEGKVAIVTGANTGLGFLHAKVLVQKGCEVIFACRDKVKALYAIENIKNECKNANIHFIPLDLSSLISVEIFCEVFLKKHNHLDFLVNNAAVVNLESKHLSQDNIEMHLSTNHFGHFALTNYLFQTLINTKNSRVVTLTSGAYKVGKIDFDDLSMKNTPYNRVKAYGNSKLANLLFTIELQNRFNKYSSNSKSIACHLGLTASKRQQEIGIGGFLAKIMATPLQKGVLPQIRATFDDTLQGGTLLGPKFGIWGQATVKTIEKEYLNKEKLMKFWKESEEIIKSLKN